MTKEEMLFTAFCHFKFQADPRGNLRSRQNDQAAKMAVETVEAWEESLARHAELVALGEKHNLDDQKFVYFGEHI